MTYLFSSRVAARRSAILAAIVCGNVWAIACGSTSPTPNGVSTGNESDGGVGADGSTGSPDSGGSATGDSGAPDGSSNDSGSIGSGVILGVYSDKFGKLNKTITGASGRSLAIENQRETWGTDFQQADEAADLDGGVIPMISWAVSYNDNNPDAGGSCASYVKIMNGTYDSPWVDSGGVSHPGLIQEALAIKALGVPFLIRFFKEFTDTADDSCFYGTDHPSSNPQLYGPMLVNIWQHVVDLFKAQGANNVQWIWGPSANLFFDGAKTDDVTWRYFYPGNNYVDWVSNDNYNKSATDLKDYASDPNVISWYAVTSTLGKPLMQAETGAGYDAGMDPDPMTEWLQSAYTSIPTAMPAMKAFVWWSSDGQVDYDLQGNGLTLYEQVAADPYWKKTDATPYFSSAGRAAGPTQPTNVTAVASGGSVLVQWTASTDTSSTIALYNIYRNGVAIGTSTVASYTDPSVALGTNVAYTVDAIDKAFNRSVQSAAANVTP